METSCNLIPCRRGWIRTDTYRHWARQNCHHTKLLNQKRNFVLERLKRDFKAAVRVNKKAAGKVAMTFANRQSSLSLHSGRHFFPKLGIKPFSSAHKLCKIKNPGHVED